MASSSPAVASSMARRLAEAAITHLRASSTPFLAVALPAVPSASPTLVSAARATATSPIGCYQVVFPAASSASSVQGSSPTPSAPPSALHLFVSAARATCPFTCYHYQAVFPASSSASSVRASSPTPSAPPSALHLFVSAARATCPFTCYHYQAVFPAASSASSVRASSPTPSAPPSAVYFFTSTAPPTSESLAAAISLTATAPTVCSPLAMTGSGVGDANKSALIKCSPHVRRCNTVSSPTRIDRRCYSNRAWTPWDRSPQLPTEKSVHDRPWAWTPWDRTRPKGPQEVNEFLKRLNEVNWTPEEQIKLKEAFLKKFFGEDSEHKPVGVQFELILIKLDELKKIMEAWNKKKTEWGTFKLWGRKMDFSKVLSVIGLFFKS